MSGVRDTSIEVFHRIREEGLLSERRLEVYSSLFQHGPASANELFRKMHGSIRVSQAAIQPRLNELVAMGVASEVQIRPCRVTGNRVIEYDVTSKMPKKLEKKEPTKLRRVNPYKLAFDIKTALLIGPMSQMNNRLDRVFREHFGFSWSEIVVDPKPRQKHPTQTEIEF